MKCIVCGKEYEGKACPHCWHDPGKENDPHFLPVGTELANGKYTIGNTVGAGGFGVTYAAWDHVLDTKVAIKEYMPGEFSTRMPGTKQLTIYGGEKEEQFLAGMVKFLDESRRLAQFAEVPGIVQIFDYFKENNTAYIVMEFLNGKTLAERIKKEKKLSFDDALEVMLPVLEALEAIHKEGMIHRDVAPNNIMITDDGKVKLLDFGAARLATGSYSKSLSVMFKDGFTPEEQYRSRGKQGPWTDVYAAAGTLYKALTGVTPEGALERKVKDELKPPSKRGAKIPAKADIAILNALNVDAEKRTQSAAEFRKELCGEVSVKKHYERTEEKKAGKVPTRVWVLGGLGIAAAAALLIVFLTTDLLGTALNGISNFISGRNEVPDVTGMRLEAAKEVLDEDGIRYDAQAMDFILDVDPGWVKSQSVPGKESIEADEKLTLYYSGYPETLNVNLDPFVGGDVAEAEKELKELQFEVERIEEESTEWNGCLISYETPGGGFVQGNKVTLHSSIGIKKPTEQGDYEVESLTGKDFEELKDILARGYGVYLVVRDIKYVEDYPDGQIIWQSLEEGQTAKKDTIIKVDISGDKMTTMPEVLNMKCEDVEKILKDAGLSEKGMIPVKTTDESQKGIVIGLGEGVKEGAQIEKGSAPEIYYGLRSFEIQDLIGRTEEEAKAICEANNIKYSTPHRVRGGDHTVKRQYISVDGKIIDMKAKDLISEDEYLELDIGIPTDEYDREYTETFETLLNQKLRTRGITHEVRSGVQAAYVGTAVNWTGYLPYTAEALSTVACDWISARELGEWPQYWAQKEDAEGVKTIVVGFDLDFSANGVRIKYNNQDCNVPDHPESFVDY